MKIEIEAQVDWEPGFTSGRMRMVFQDTVADVMDGDEKIGRVAGTIGAGMEIAIGEYRYFLSPQAIWEAVSEAHEKRVAARAESAGNSS